MYLSKVRARSRRPLLSTRNPQPSSVWKSAVRRIATCTSNSLRRKRAWTHGTGEQPLTVRMSGWSSNPRGVVLISPLAACCGWDRRGIRSRPTTLVKSSCPIRGRPSSFPCFRRGSLRRIRRPEHHPPALRAGFFLHPNSALQMPACRQAGAHPNC